MSEPTPELRLTRVRPDAQCPNGLTCPAVYRSNRGTAFIIGTQVTDPAALGQAPLGPGEVLIEVPGELIPEVMRDAD
jgi:hypothetical protein